MVHFNSSCHRITWTLSVCVEGLCNIFFCASSNRFVWVLPLLLPLPVTSWSDSSVLLLRWVSLAVSVRGWSSTDTGIWILGMPSREEMGLWAVKHTTGGPEQLTMNSLQSAVVIATLYTNQKSAVCPEVFPQGPPCPKAHIVSNFLGTF